LTWPGLFAGGRASSFRGDSLRCSNSTVCNKTAVHRPTSADDGVRIQDIVRRCPRDMVRTSEEVRDVDGKARDHCGDDRGRSKSAVAAEGNTPPDRAAHCRVEIAVRPERFVATHWTFPVNGSAPNDRADREAQLSAEWLIWLPAVSPSTCPGGRAQIPRLGCDRPARGEQIRRTRWQGRPSQCRSSYERQGVRR